MKNSNLFLMILFVVLNSTLLFSQSRSIKEKIEGNHEEESYMRLKKIKEIRIERYQYKRGKTKGGKSYALNKYNEYGKLILKEKAYWGNGSVKEVEIKKYDKNQRLIKNIEIKTYYKIEKTILSMEYSKDSTEVIVKVERLDGKSKSEKIKHFLINKEGKVNGLRTKIRDTVNYKSKPNDSFIEKLETVEQEIENEKANLSEYRVLENLMYKIYRDERSNITKKEMYIGDMEQPYSLGSFKYDENNNLIFEEYYEKNKLIEIYKHSYENDLLILTEYYDRRERLKYTDKYEYEFYEKNN